MAKSPYFRLPSKEKNFHTLKVCRFF